MGWGEGRSRSGKKVKREDRFRKSVDGSGEVLATEVG